MAWIVASSFVEVDLNNINNLLRSPNPTTNQYHAVIDPDDAYPHARSFTKYDKAKAYMLELYAKEVGRAAICTYLDRTKTDPHTRPCDSKVDTITTHLNSCTGYCEFNKRTGIGSAGITYTYKWPPNGKINALVNASITLTRANRTITGKRRSIFDYEWEQRDTSIVDTFTEEYADMVSIVQLLMKDPATQISYVMDAVNGSSEVYAIINQIAAYIYKLLLDHADSTVASSLISKEKLLESAARYGKSPYGKHLKAVAEGKVRY